MDLELRIWRQPRRDAPGRFVDYPARDLSSDMSFLEMLDVVNEGLIERGEEPVAFDHDCREGICGSCGMMINGVAHGPRGAMATCQLHLRHFRDGDRVTIEPWRARAFPVVRERGPWATPLIISPHMPQMPSRQSWSKAMGSSPRVCSPSLTTSSISRKDMSGLSPGAS